MKPDQLKEEIKKVIESYAYDRLDITFQDEEKAADYIMHLFQSHLEQREKKLTIGHLRMFLNECRIDDPKKMVTNEEIKTMLGLAQTPSKDLGDKS